MQIMTEKKTNIVANAMRGTNFGNIPKRHPNVVAIPFPPLNYKKTGKICPMKGAAITSDKSAVMLPLV